MSNLLIFPSFNIRLPCSSSCISLSASRISALKLGATRFKMTNGGIGLGPRLVRTRSCVWMRSSTSATLGRVTTYERPVESGLNVGDSRPATREELGGLFKHLEDELERLGFFNPPHKRQAMMRNLRSMFLRMGATEQEVRTLRGVVATLSAGKGLGRKVP